MVTPENFGSGCDLVNIYASHRKSCEGLSIIHSHIDAGGSLQLTNITLSGRQRKLGRLQYLRERTSGDALGNTDQRAEKLFSHKFPPLGILGETKKSSPDVENNLTTEDSSMRNKFSQSIKRSEPFQKASLLGMSLTAIPSFFV
jgi:hypothetical protein